ncbi:hypothetical protein LTR56_001985 [Elasticomyces elasticus]|nr:hypothetical protein LTR22_011570 [Elasticomyces elasticus]KAK3658129.1 hypothetical protein LTR56_001985 [Elasticomyces elasticus]KAK5749139.1 hypothetical protein LTS12_020834 [Elasticomyces elasticus]
MAEQRLKEKQAFYANRDEVLADSDDEPDPGRTASIKMLRKSSKAMSSPPSKHGSNSLARSASETNLAKDPLRSFNAGPPERPKTSGGRAPPKLVKSATTTGVPSNVPSIAAPAPVTAIPKMPKSSLKRKRDGTIELVPEALQIFKGMHFYFFPNDDKNPARAMRMMKAIEYGATWQKDWNASVTHVIVDKVYDYSTLMKHLKMDSLPDGVAVVTETYPSDCIGLRVAFNPNQARFQVKGYARPEKKPDAIVTPTSSTEQQKSLELKPAGRSVMARPPDSPRTTDEAASSQQHSVTPMKPPIPPSTRSHHDPPEPMLPAPVIESTAEFDAAMQQARDLQYVPLEDEGDDASRPVSSEGPATDDEEQPKAVEKISSKTVKGKSKYTSYQDKFQCMQKHTAGTTDGPNAHTITILQQMADYYGQTGDEWRIRAYRKAMATLRNHPTKVSTKEEALALPQIGERLAIKIEEIATTSRLRRLDNAKAEPNDQLLQTFMQVYGAGMAKASEWVAQGHKTLDELLEKADLTVNQRIGIEHYEDFNSRIPRAEVEQHGAMVQQALHKIDPTFEVIVGGSYRRGAATSGDIDCLITRPDTGSAHLRVIVLEQLVPKLAAAGFLVAALASTNKDDGSKWHGASCLPGRKTWRRIDLLLVPSDEMGAALIYFTGNDIFNRSMRLLASTKGMRLNQRGLYKECLRGYRREKLSEGTLVEGKNEKKIFAALGVPWRIPEHRIC